MKKRFIFTFIFITLIAVIKIKAQQNSLIFENDSIAIYDTYLSLNSKENISPVIYKDGLIYASANKTGFYKLYYSDFINKPQKIRINSTFHTGSVAVYNNEVYFTKSSKIMRGDSVINLTIFRGEFENLKVSKIKPLPLCKTKF